MSPQCCSISFVEESLYQAQVACRVCGVTPRMLDYWITRGAIAPTKAYRARNGTRDLFLFSFEDLIRVRIVRSLRESGVSLARIISAIQQLRRVSGPDWHREWLVSDGRGIYRRTGNDALESLSGKDQGQLAFAVVAVGSARALLSTTIKKHKPFNSSNLNGDVRRYRRSG